MSVLDIRRWSFLDWIGVASFAIAALIQALNAALKDAPAVADKMPAFISWSYLPLVLVLVTFAVILYRLFTERPAAREGEQRVNVRPKRAELPRTPIVGPFKIVNDPPAEFRLLPIHYSVDLAAPLPYVQASFYGVNFLPDSITLIQARLSLRLFGAAPLEAISPVSDDFLIDPKFAPMVVFRRNLTDSELRNLPWRAGREMGSFELSAKATDGGETLSYVVGSMVIEGWINGPVKPVAPPPDSPERDEFRITTLPDGTVPLPEAARVLYEVARSKGRYLAVAAERLSGSEGGNITDGTPEDILNFMATYIGGKALLYGVRPPSEKREPLMRDEAKRGTFESGALVLKGMNVYTDLAVSKSDLYRIIGGLEQSET